MSSTDFLFNGAAPANLNTTTSDTSSLPAWYQSYLQGLMGTANTVAATPYQQYSGPMLADFNPTQQTAFSQAQNIGQAGQPAMSGAQGALTSAASQNIPGAVAPYAAASTGAATPEGIQSYMSPYLNNQLQGISDMAQQNWNQFTAPSVNNSFISSGGYGSGRNAEVMGQQANLANQATTAALANAANSAYSTAGTQAGTQAGILQSAGQLMGNATQQQGALQTAAGSAQGALGQQAQNMALQQASATQAVGNQQQSQDQSNLDLAYQQFENQVAYPQQQVNFMSNTIRGLQSPGTSTSVSSNQPASPFASTSPSIANTLAGLASGSTGTSGSNVLFAKGGHVKRQGGALSGMPQDRATRTPDGGMYVPHSVLNQVAMMLAQKGKGALVSRMGGQPGMPQGQPRPMMPPPRAPMGALSMGAM